MPKPLKSTDQDYKPGRNDPCSCGSGKKYKRCCLNNVEHTNSSLSSSPIPIEALLRTAVEHHQADRMRQADEVYKTILKADPKNADALHLSGLVARHFGNQALAIKRIQTAIKIKPSAAMHYNLALSWQEQGDVTKSINSYKKAILLNPQYAEAYVNLAVVYQQLQKFNMAVDCYQTALNLQPHNADIYSNLAVSLEAGEKYEDAIVAYKYSIKYARTAQTYNNLANLFRHTDRLDESVANYRKSIELDPNYIEAYSNLGNTLCDQGNISEGLECFERTLEINPNHNEAKWNASMALLALGELAQGWKWYETRFLQIAQREDKARHPEKAITTSDQINQLKDKSILLWAEQGVGDEIYFAGVFEELITRAGLCVIEADSRLISLFERSFPEAEFIPKQDKNHSHSVQPEVDYQCPMGSLPRWFRNDIQDFPKHEGYLKANGNRVTYWQKQLETLGKGLNIGISWRSMNMNAVRNRDYTELKQWQAIFALKGVNFINLQYDKCDDEIDAAEKMFDVKIHRWKIDLLNDLDEAAALTSALDIIVSPMTSVAAMAGALGKTVLKMVPAFDWTQLGGEQNNGMLWYPDTKVFVRQYDQEWDRVLEKIATDIKKQLGSDSN